MLLTQQHVLAKVTLATQSKVVLVDRSWDEISLQPATPLNIPADLTRLMYMIFTSGQPPSPTPLLPPSTVVFAGEPPLISWCMICTG